MNFVRFGRDPSHKYAFQIVFRSVGLTVQTWNGENVEPCYVSAIVTTASLETKEAIPAGFAAIEASAEYQKIIAFIGPQPVCPFKPIKWRQYAYSRFACRKSFPSPQFWHGETSKVLLGMIVGAHIRS